MSTCEKITSCFTTSWSN